MIPLEFYTVVLLGIISSLTLLLPFLIFRDEFVNNTGLLITILESYIKGLCTSSLYTLFLMLVSTDYLDLGFNSYSVDFLFDMWAYVFVKSVLVW